MPRDHIILIASEISFLLVAQFISSMELKLPAYGLGSDCWLSKEFHNSLTILSWNVLLRMFDVMFSNKSGKLGASFNSNLVELSLTYTSLEFKVYSKKKSASYLGHLTYSYKQLVSRSINSWPILSCFLLSLSYLQIDLKKDT